MQKEIIEDRNYNKDNQSQEIFARWRGGFYSRFVGFVALEKGFPRDIILR